MIKDTILFLGDIHGNFEYIPKFLKSHKITNAAILQVGDFGIGWNTEKKEIKKLKYLNHQLKNYDCELIVIRGNHDDPSYYTGKYYFNNIKLIPDYTVININKLNFLGIGGAVSIDRSDRKPFIEGKGVGWWKDEILTYNDIIEHYSNIDVVFTHTAPNFSFPQIKSNLEYWYEKDRNLMIDVNNERNLMSQIYEMLTINNKITHWYYGHFHMSKKEPYENTDFILCNINEFVEHRF